MTAAPARAEAAAPRPVARRRARERRTMAAMIALYCRDHHGGPALCPACAALDAYAAQRLERCVYGDEKPTCATCPVHCYRPEMREAARQVMRWAGPRMPWRHPLLALAHLLDGRRPVPATGRRGRPVARPARSR